MLLKNVILSSYVKGHVKKNSSLNFMSLVGFQASKIGFSVNRHSKMQKISVNNIFFAFLSHHNGFTNCFEILNFAFSNIILSRVSTCKILPEI